MNVPFIDLRRANQPLAQELLEAFGRVVDRSGFCLGPEVEAFEAAFARAQGLPRCVALGSGTEALHLVALALGVGPGDEVILPAATFVATAWFAEHAGAKIVFADVDPVTYTLDPRSAAERVTERTKAIVAVHLYGQPADMDPLLAIGRERGVAVVEDAAQAHLARYKGRPVGALGAAGIFSFYPTKNLGGLGEGGCAASADEALLDRIAVLRVHGSRERYVNERVGYNNRMEGLQAAALNVKLPHLPYKTARRQSIARRYLGGVANRSIRLPQPVRWGDSVYHQFTALHPERDRLRAYLAEKGVGTDVIYPRPLHLQPCFASLGYGEGDFPVSERLAAQCLSLPIMPELTDEEVGYVIDCLNDFE